MIEPRLNYYYAMIVPETGLCYGVCTSITPHNHESYVEINSLNEDYELKYYNKANGRWYHDAEFRNEWIPTVK